nr:C. briggsae CBR-TAG-343 protein [Haemonchus contortus]
MSGTPPLSHQLPRINKFVGEAFEEHAITRTIFVSSEEDKSKKESRVILLIGPQSARKTSLIDFLCNYFYGAKLDEPTRYHIANEKFDSTTPEKQIITYVFNDTIMDFRPVVIDTPSTSGIHGEENRRILAEWLKDNSNRVKIDAVGVVFSAYSRLTSIEEEGLQKALQLFPPHMGAKQIVFITGSDGSSLPVGLLRRLNLDRADVYKVNTSCIFQRSQDDPLQEHLRGNYWRMSVANFEALFSRLKYGITSSRTPESHEDSTAQSVSLGGLSRSHDDSIAQSVSLGGLSRSSISSRDTPGLKYEQAPSLRSNISIDSSHSVISSQNSVDTSRLKYEQQPPVHTLRSHGISPPTSGNTGESSGSSQSSRDTVIRQFNEKLKESLTKDFPVLPSKIGTTSSVTRRSSISQKSAEAPSRLSSASFGVTTTTRADDTAKVTQPTAKVIEHRPVLVKTTILPREEPKITSKISIDSKENVLKKPSQPTNGKTTADGVKASGPSTVSQNRTREQPTQLSTETVTKYVYEVSTRSHKRSFGELNGGSATEPDRKISSSSKPSRETTIDDPYYPTVVVRPKGTPSTGRHSLYEIRPETTLTSEASNRSPRKIPKETLIDFRNETSSTGALVDREPIPYFSLLRSRSADRIDTISSPGRLEFAVDPNGRRYENVPNLYTADQMNTPTSRVTMPTSRVPPRDSSGRIEEPNQNVNLDDVRLRNRNEFTRERDDGKRGFEPTYAQQNIGAPYHLYDQPPREDFDKNGMMVSGNMTSNQRPLTQIEVNRKSNAQSSVKSYHDSDYGDDWGDETRIVHRVDNARPLPQLVEEVYRSRHYPGTTEPQQHMNENQTPVARPSYIPLPYPSQTPGANITQGGGNGLRYGGAEIRQLDRGGNGMMTLEKSGIEYGGPVAHQVNTGRNGMMGIESTGMEYGGADTRLLYDGRGGMPTTKKVTTTVTSTKRQPFQIRVLRWTPSNCSDSRDCCLNCLFFVVVPLVVIIIVTVIVLVIIFS